jgi:acyl transferase domain-containing protein/NADPH:quinone reductase-like Zn-dependent oxidoreductase/NAD(P)-dependent dehydrogenase (short-subunit alcohol dehydrogenase family)/acyl carrier protein
MSNNNYEPIAIVGIGCRYPGSSSSPEKFWKMLVNKTDAVGDVPSDRWDMRKYYSANEARPGKMRHKQGGFISENLMEFDPLFFNMSPRESESLDPQQRMLLEISYEALEDAGITLEAVKGSRTGVFVGGFLVDNLLSLSTPENRYEINSHTMSTNALTMLSNRISYIFDLKGPSLSIDTACSSSLVAAHYACQSIWNGESDMAWVGGVNYMSIPETSILASKGKFLSNHSRCKAFDSDAAGYVRGEGAGIVILKKLSQAIKDNDKIYATIVGSGANQDGATNGITVPSGEAQLQLIREVYEKYNIDKNNIHYVEAHGTGTQVGDPIEFKALNAALASNEPRESKCMIGSVKTNIGHLEAGSGVAGLIKAALCLHHNAVPPNLHFNNPNPALNYEQSNLRVPVSLESLPAGSDSFASINSFGFGGTNAHLVLKQYQAPEAVDETAKLKESHFIFPISANSSAALKEFAGKYRKHIEQHSDSFDNILSNAIYRKSSLPQRLAIFATSQEDLAEKLDAYEQDLLLKGVNQGSPVAAHPKLVFVYTGIGPQWWKMGREMMETEPVFLNSILECDSHFKEIAGWSVREELLKPMELSRLQETNIAQPANFFIQVAITKLLEHYGIIPDAVVGHSLGEVASAYISGAMTLKDALWVNYHRSRLQYSTSGMGLMLAVGLSEADALEIIKPYDDISIGAINSPKSITLAGGSDSIKSVMEKVEARGAFCRLLDVTIPFHSPVMNLIKDDMMDCLSHIAGNPTKIDLYSTVTGTKLTGTEVNNQHWWENVRQPVFFSKAINTITADGYTVFIEIGPHPVLRNSLQECTNNSKDFHFLQTLNRKESEQLTFYDNIAKLFTLGFPIKWDRWIERSSYIKSPTYPWQREYLWRHPQKNAESKTTGNSLFLDARVEGPSTVYELELNEQYYPFLSDHVVQGKVLFPGAGYVSLAMGMYQIEVSRKLPVQIENIQFRRVLPVYDDEIQKLQVSFNAQNGCYDFYSKTGVKDASWMDMSSGRFTVGNFESTAPVLHLKEIQSRLHASLSQNDIYEKLSRAKLDYGPYFRCIQTIQSGDRELLAKVSLHPEMKACSGDYLMHPTMLDACLQTTIILFSGDCVPVSIGKIHCYSQPGHEVICYSTLKYANESSMIADMLICNEAGEVCMRIESLKCKQLVKSSTNTTENLKDKLFQPKWAEKKSAAETAVSNKGQLTCIITNDAEYCYELQQLIPGAIIAETGNEYKKVNDQYYRIDTENAAQVDSLWSTDHTAINIIAVAPVSTYDITLPHSEKCMQQLMPVFHIAQRLAESAKGDIKLSIITTGSQAVTEKDVTSTPEYSVLHGLGRSIVNELPGCKVLLIDVERNDEETWKKVVSVIDATDSFYAELALRNGRLYEKKMVDWEINKTQSLKKVDFQSEVLQLNIPAVTGSASFLFGPATRNTPASGEIEILIDHASINYKDYLKLSNKAADDSAEETIFGKTLGNECAGTVTRVGASVSRFKEGDKVLALAPGTLQTYTTTSELLAVKCPASLTTAASGVIGSYVTAIYCLRDKANLKKGNKILIHNGAEGTGLAAVYYALYAGAEVFATAQTDEQRLYLQSIGVKHVFNSQSLDFAQEIKDITGGKGVDVLLSALSGEQLYQSFACLSPYGVYVDLNCKEGLPGMALAHHNFSYIAVDIDRMLIERQEMIAALLEDMAARIESGHLPVLPAKVLPANQITAAIEHFTESSIFSKVIVDFANQTVEIENTGNNPIKASGTYLITGGTKGLGLEVGKWLVEKGAKNLALVSRSGLRDADAKATVETMRENGINVQVYAVDIADTQETEAMFSNIKADLPELAGIFHGAMVLDDGHLKDMTEDRFRNVLRPKVDGAMNLHWLTKDLRLDFFVVFSSISSLIGNIGQANYVAANAFLDSFAAWRRSLGLAATAINLGSLAESGVVARSENLVKIIEGTGINGLTNKQVMQGLDLILKENPEQVGFFDITWNVFINNAGKTGQILFDELSRNNADTMNEQLSTEQLSNRSIILGMDGSYQHQFVTELLQKQLGKILKISTDNISLDKGINLLGVDSILTVELMGAIWNSFAVSIPPIEFLTGPTVKQLSGKIVENFVQPELA